MPTDWLPWPGKIKAVVIIEVSKGGAARVSRRVVSSLGGGGPRIAPDPGSVNSRR